LVNCVNVLKQQNGNRDEAAQFPRTSAATALFC
jgi:hypothetical protein